MCRTPPTRNRHGTENSVGHYEGDTLVVDTIAVTTKAPVDNYRTPHTEQLHVIERFRLINGGNTIEVDIRVEDAGAFTTPVERYTEVYQARARSD